jgi:hypothetical protein
MKYNQPLQDASVPLWRRITAFINIVLLTFYTCLPGTAAAYQLISDGFIASEINSNPQFQLSTNSNYLVEKSYYITDTTSTSTQTIASFHQKLLDHRKSSLPTPLMIPIINGDITIIIPHYPLEKLIGDSFVQARFIRSQIFNQLNRNLLNDSIGTEAQQINALYNRAFDFSAVSNKRFGEQLTRADINTFGHNFIWPELRTVNNQKILVPIVHLTDATIDAQLVDSHVVEFSGTETEFNNITIDSGELLLRRGTSLNVASNLSINDGALLKSSHDLNVVVGGTLQILSGQITAQDNMKIIAGQYVQKTVVHRFATPTSQGTRLGEIASVNAITGNVSIKTAGDLVIKGGTVSGNNIILQADGNIILQSQETTYTSSGVVNGWDESESTVTQLQSQLTAKDSIALIAAGAIEISATTLHAEQGTIDILAGQGVYILSADNKFQSARSGKFGSNTIQEQEFQSIAVRSALNAGQGIVIATEFGDINLKATEITSTTGTEIRANNGAVNFLMTKEQETYFYNKVNEGTWKIKTTTIEDNVETAVYNQIIGGVKVHATNGLTIELAQYENGSTQENGQDTLSARIAEDIQALKAQINAAKASGQSTSSLDAQLASLSDDLLQEQLSQLAGADSSLAWMQDIHNDPEYQDNFNIVYQELVEIHKFDKTSTLSPAAMAIIAIAVSVAMGPAGFEVIGASGVGGAGALGSAIEAGILSITNQAAVGLASGHGLENTAKSLFHSDNIKATVTAMVTAGVLDKLQGQFEYFSATPEVPLTNAQTIANQATQAVGNAAVRTGISTVINGGDLGDFKESFKSALMQSGVDTLGEYMAGQIGESFSGTEGALDTGLKYIFHAGAGCIIGAATAEINGSDTGTGCGSGAGGAVVGELVAESLKTTEEYETAYKALKDFADKNSVQIAGLKAKGYSDKAIINKLSSTTNLAQSLDQINKLKAQYVDISKFTAALSAFAAGADAAGINTAATTGENAAENNALGLYIIYKIIIYSTDPDDFDQPVGPIEESLVASADDVLTHMVKMQQEYGDDWLLDVTDTNLAIIGGVVAGILDTGASAGILGDVAVRALHDFNTLMNGQSSDYSAQSYARLLEAYNDIVAVVDNFDQIVEQASTLASDTLAGAAANDPESQAKLSRFSTNVLLGVATGGIGAAKSTAAVTKSLNDISKLDFANDIDIAQLANKAATDLPDAGIVAKTDINGDVNYKVEAPELQISDDLVPLSNFFHEINEPEIASSAAMLAKLDEVTNTAKGQRPVDPRGYLPAEYYDRHIALFNDGAVRFTSQNSLEQFGTLGPNGGFVMPKSEFDNLLYDTGGNLRLIEQKLELPVGYYGDGSDLLIAHIKPENMNGLRLPSGNELGAMDGLWISGGYTKGGIPEAVMDFENVTEFDEIFLD